jgi:2-polyprenyl-3-methyl-5-hydroxy-6-metoxy-1,4-benzoquinol methylase
VPVPLAPAESISSKIAVSKCVPFQKSRVSVILVKKQLIEFLDRLFGFYGSLMHWDTTVLDRWLWLRQFYRRRQPETVLDVGCGGGAFTIGLARMGHDTLGLTYDQASLEKAGQRAVWYGGRKATFRLCDVRKLDQEHDLKNRFDSVICLECIEHILNDKKLVKDMAACLKPGGRLYLTTPNIDYIPITPSDAGPFEKEETGWHVRKGYGEKEIRELFENTGLQIQRITFCSGFLSQKITWILRTVERWNHLLALAVILPLRLLPPLFDPVIARLTKWPGYSICVVAVKTDQL